MGNETIFYYVTEEAVTGQKRMITPHFWQKITLPSFVVEKEGIMVVAVMIPALSKGWKSEKLLRLMQETMEGHPLYAGNAGILIQPGLQLLLAEKKRGKGKSPEKRSNGPALPEAQPQTEQSDAFLSLAFPLAEIILREQFPVSDRKRGPEAVVLLLGELFFPEEQMQHFEEMVQPYLPRVNALTVLYGTGDDVDRKDETLQQTMEMQSGMDADEESGGMRESGRLEKIIQDYTEKLYYEYGLVSQVLSGEQPVKGPELPGRQSPVLFLDYGYSGMLPFRMLKKGGIYIDIASSKEKEAVFRRKYRGIFYQSPRKYLDTMVKSGYDK